MEAKEQKENQMDIAADSDDQNEFIEGSGAKRPELDIIANKLKDDPYNPALYQETIKYYEKFGLIEMIRKTRQEASKKGALTEEMWKAWIEFEKNEAKNFAERVEITKLYEKALNSFNCI